MKLNKTTLLSASFLLIFVIGSFSTALAFDPADYDTYDEGYEDAKPLGIEEGFWRRPYGYSLGEDVDLLATQEYKDGFANSYDEWYWNYYQFPLYIIDPVNCDEYEEGQRDGTLFAERDMYYGSSPRTSLPSEDMEDWASEEYAEAFFRYYLTTYWSNTDPQAYDWGYSEGDVATFNFGYADGLAGLPNDVTAHYIIADDIGNIDEWYLNMLDEFDPFVVGYNDGLYSEQDYGDGLQTKYSKGYELGAMSVIAVPTISLEEYDISLNTGGECGYLVEFEVSLSGELPEGYILTTEVADLSFDGVGIFTAIVFDGGEILSNIYLDGEVEESEILTFSIDTLGLVLDELDDLSEIEIFNRHQRAFDNKMRVLKNLVLDGEYDEAYSKLLHDIKPKLTNEKPCGRGHAKGKRFRFSHGRRAWTTPSVEIEQQIDAILWALSEL